MLPSGGTLRHERWGVAAGLYSGSETRVRGVKLRRVGGWAAAVSPAGGGGGLFRTGRRGEEGGSDRPLGCKKRTIHLTVR